MNSSCLDNKHTELITKADEIVIKLLNGRVCDAEHLAKQYRQFRIDIVLELKRRKEAADG